MRLVLLHGINQQGSSSEKLTAEWMSHLRGSTDASLPVAKNQFEMPYYGDCLAAYAELRSSGLVRQGTSEPERLEETTFVVAGLLEQAQAAGMNSKEIEVEARSFDRGAIEQGFPMGRRLNAIARLLEKVSPAHGDLAVRLLRQAYVYLRHPQASLAVDQIVEKALLDGPTVVVSHSLGTVIAFKLLRKLASAGRPADVPLLVTLGSPLSLMTVQAALGAPLEVPGGVGRWLNAIDPRDFVGLGRGLDEATFCSGVHNIIDVVNRDDDAHSIEGYLADARVSAAVLACFAEPAL